MADNLCGPSNALQSFQKHTSVDRTLQQDRLTSRQTPAQSFRSGPGPNAGILDPEFDAFQAGHAVPLHQPGIHFSPPHAPPPQFAHAPQAPDWASDFQRLNIQSAQLPSLQHRPPQASKTTASWHQDFLKQQAPAGQPQAQQQSMFGGIPRQGMGYSAPMYQQTSGFGVMNGAPLSQAAQGKQRVQEEVPQFDDAAFEEAFKQAHQDALEEALPGNDPAYVNAMHVLTELDSLAIPQTNIPYEIFLDTIERFEHEGILLGEVGQFTVEQLRYLTDIGYPGSELHRERTENLFKKINERLMSEHPLLSSAEQEINVDMNALASDMNIDIGKMREEWSKAALRQRMDEEVKQGREQEQPQRNDDDDEMAATAGQLLNSVADNTSEKFQNSQFLELMRRLRDREVRVEGDKMVDVSNAQSFTTTATANTNNTTSSTSPPTDAAIPPIDPGILGHAATDFAMPLDSEQEIQNSLYE